MDMPHLEDLLAAQWGLNFGVRLAKNPKNLNHKTQGLLSNRHNPEIILHKTYTGFGSTLNPKIPKL